MILYRLTKKLIYTRKTRIVHQKPRIVAKRSFMKLFSSGDRSSLTIAHILTATIQYHLIDYSRECIGTRYQKGEKPWERGWGVHIKNSREKGM